MPESVLRQLGGRAMLKRRENLQREETSATSKTGGQEARAAWLKLSLLI